MNKKTFSKKPKFTLFDRDLLSKEIGRAKEPQFFPYAASSLARSEKVGETEGCIFTQVLEHEGAIYEERGLLSGGITYTLGGGELVEPKTSALSLPNFVEQDYMKLVSCSAKQVIVLQDHWTHQNVAPFWPYELDQSIVVAGAVPRFGMRRLLHRIAKQFAIPIYVMVDNDTWGYFIASLLRRGIMDPSREFPYASCPDVRFLGLTTKDFVDLPSEVLRDPWQPVWKLRLDAMRQYPCFQSEPWQRELDQFERQKGKVEFDAMIKPLGAKWIIEEIILKRISAGEYLKLE
jgi:DNA topoisomerase VI subunit A